MNTILLFIIKFNAQYILQTGDWKLCNYYFLVEWDTVIRDRKPITELPNTYKSVLGKKKMSEKCLKQHFPSRQSQNWVKTQVLKGMELLGVGMTASIDTQLIP